MRIINCLSSCADRHFLFRLSSNCSLFLALSLFAPTESVARLAEAGENPMASGVVGVTRWTMINVTPANAQADCHLLEFPDNKVVLIDTADAVDAPGAALAYLQQRGISYVDLVVISHFHLDHYGRLTDIIDAGIKVRRVAINLPYDRKMADREHPWGCNWDHVMSVLQFLNDRQIPYFTPKAGDRLIEVASEEVPVYLEVVCLFDGANAPFEVTINDTSILLRLTVGSHRVLFTGDAGRGLGDYLLTTDTDLSADVLKVPHHGAEVHPSNEFYDRIKPKVALVPVSENLWVNDPRLRRSRLYFLERGIPVFVSGIDGHTTVHLTAVGYQIKSERGAEFRSDHVR